MAGILSFQQYLGGPDQLQVQQVFPSDQRSLVYDFHQDITGWQFHSDYQTVVVDTMQFSRSTGEPNFNNSQVIGYFAYADIPPQFQPSIIDAEAGKVLVHLPSGLYTHAIVPDARVNVPITIVSITWQDASIPPQINTHRWALIQCYEPGVDVGDPTLAPDFVPLITGA